MSLLPPGWATPFFTKPRWSPASFKALIRQPQCPCKRFASSSSLSYREGGGFGPKKGDKVVVAMSGGVDSSVTARLLAEKDFDLSAVFMRNWSTQDEGVSEQGCEWEKDWEDVQRVCGLLGIPCRMIDLSRQYWVHVFEPAIDEWAAGVTPNPDIACNREIKFGALMDRVLGEEHAWLATGHYARIGWDMSAGTGQPRARLLRAKDRSKDQTYYLSAVNEAKLRKALYPLGAYLKTEVREMARKFRLPTAENKESMGICFVGERNGSGGFGKFLGQYIPSSRGNIVLPTGEIVGSHQGLYHYTIGQKARLSGQREKLFVAKKKAATNEIVVVPGPDHPALFCASIDVPSIDWINSDDLPQDVDSEAGLRALCQVRYRQAEAPCVVKRKTDGTYTATFPVPQLAVAPGQTLALYDGERCLGGGIIHSTQTVDENEED